MSGGTDNSGTGGINGPGLRNTLVLVPLPLPPAPPPDPADCFAAMEEEIAAGGETTELEPVLACPKTWIDLTLLQDDGTPLADMPYRITAPGGDGRTGRLDGNGHIRIDGVDVPAETAVVRVSVTDDSSNPDAEPVYELQVVPRDEVEVLAQDPEPDETEEPEYFFSGFELTDDPLDPDVDPDGT